MLKASISGCSYKYGSVRALHQWHVIFSAFVQMGKRGISCDSLSKGSWHWPWPPIWSIFSGVFVFYCIKIRFWDTHSDSRLVWGKVRMNLSIRNLIYKMVISTQPQSSYLEQFCCCIKECPHIHLCKTQWIWETKSVEGDIFYLHSKLNTVAKTFSALLGDTDWEIFFLAYRSQAERQQ